MTAPSMLTYKHLSSMHGFATRKQVTNRNRVSLSWQAVVASVESSQNISHTDIPLSVSDEVERARSDHLRSDRSRAKHLKVSGPQAGHVVDCADGLRTTIYGMTRTDTVEAGR